MAVTIVQKEKQTQKVQAVPLAQATQQKSELEEMVDRLGELKRALTEIEPLQKEFDLIKKKLSEIAKADETDGEVTFKGNNYIAVFGKHTQTRSCKDLEAFLEKVGSEVFMACVKLSMADVDRYVSKLEQDVLFETTKGSRSLKSVVLNQ